MSHSTANWDFISAARIQEIFNQIVKPQCADFSMVRKGILTKQINKDIFHLIKFARYKGGVYGFAWGVSLTYVPHQWKNRLCWHRSAKTAVLDLWEQAGVDMEDTRMLAADPTKLYANFMHGEEGFRDELRTAWETLRKTVWSWLNQIAGLSDVLLVSERQAMKPWCGPGHWPPPQLIHAFTLARLGNLERAIDELGCFIAKDKLDPNNHLIGALNKIAIRSGQ